MLAVPKEDVGSRIHLTSNKEDNGWTGKFFGPEPGVTGEMSKKLPPRGEDRSLFGQLPPLPEKRNFPMPTLQDANSAVN